MNRIKRTLATLIVLLVLGCESEDPQVFQGIRINGKVTKIELSPANISNVDQTTATLTTEAITLDGNITITEHGHVWSSSDQEPTVSDSKTELGPLSETGNFISELSGLIPNRTYFVRAYVVTDIGTGYSNEVNAFTTPDAPVDVLIINEGNFFSGDGSLTSYQSFTGQVNLSAFAAANGFPIGATVQNLQPFGNDLFMVTNAPDKVEVIDAESLESNEVIQTGFLNPISFAAVGNKGYVSNWGDINTAFGPDPDSFISIIDLSTNAVTDSIFLSVRPQELLAYGTKVYVANEGGSSVSVIDTETDMITDIATAFGPSDLVLDANNHVWALCSGGSLVEIDTDTEMVVKTIDGIEVSGFDEKMTISSDGNTIYYIAAEFFPSTVTKVFSIEISATEAPAEALIEGNNFYGVGVHPESGTIYVGNSNAFISNGSVEIYDSEGEVIDNIATGIGPNGFVFL